jgi:glycosyltransferase involved in cell wall biosynthesis
LTRLSFALADRIISISNPLSENYRHSGLDPAKLRQLPQGVNTEYFHPVSGSQKKDVRTSLGLRTDAEYLGFVGAFKQRKGADILVEAFISLAQQYPNLHLLVVGPDTFCDPVRSKRHYDAFAEQLKSRIETAGLSERVVFTGQTDNVQAYLQALDIFVFPSRREGFGTAIIEAMAVGLPCILASLDGIASEISANGATAMIVEGESPDLYVKGISYLLSNPNVAAQLGKQARQRVEEVYAMDIVTSEYINLYRELLDLQPVV